MTAHRRAAGLIADAEAALDRQYDALDHDASPARQRELTAGLRRVVDGLPAWLSRPLTDDLLDHPLGRDAAPDAPLCLKVGDASLGEDREFGAVAPFLGAGHLTVDRDAGDPAVAAWLRGVLVRVLAALPGDALRVLPVDGGGLGSVFVPFQPMIDAGQWAAPATDRDAFRDALATAEQRVSAAQAGQPRREALLLAVAALPGDIGERDHDRLAALAYAGPASGVFLLIAGWPPAPPPHAGPPPRLSHTTELFTEQDEWFGMSEPAGDESYSPDGSGFPAWLTLDAGAGPEFAARISRRVAESVTAASRTDLAGLLPDRIWQESSADGLSARVGMAGRDPYTLSLDDATPHALIAGRSGGGKTNLLLVLLYALASRYSPGELTLYLLDFKEGVSFAEFTATATDPSWVPHARTVGIESDREYGLAVLRRLEREMNRRAAALKRHGVTKLAQLREAAPDLPMPRILAVIDEFQVLFAGNDRVARSAAGSLESLARKGRSYGIHLILASQTLSGIEALYTKKESIFGQFPLRVALPGGSGILDATNSAADGLAVGAAVVNDAGGYVGGNRVVRFPYAEPDVLNARRRLLWESRPPGGEPPAVFVGYAEAHVVPGPADGPVRALAGLAVDVGSPAASFVLDARPGRHVAALGTSPVGGDIVHAAAFGLAHRHEPGTARFVLACLAPDAGGTRDLIRADLGAAGHAVDEVDAHGLRAVLAGTATPGGAGQRPTYLLVLAAETAMPVLAERGPDRRTGLDDLRTVLREGPGRGVHLLSWWRLPRRFAEAVGGSAGRDDVACLVVVNVVATELGALLGDHTVAWEPRPNRALLIDRHDNRMQLIVPFVQPGRFDTFDLDQE
ncbi:cell division protein FtsK [Actinoplanes philippinensis]|nr:FtsK/SpoIIIE domain-containing protein [Actinoplanes philippinensis]GIE80580.1 cell division protein FtsK [Actinoplanes philippinensis]